MPADSNLILQAAVTKIATFNGATVDLKAGTPPRGLVARVIYSAAATSAGAGAVTFKIQESANDSTWVDLVTFDPLVLSTTAIAAEVFERVSTRKRYVRLIVSAISGTDATVTYQGDLVPAQP
jgi:Bbp16-like protein